jgi:hypothetical protein
MWLAFAVHRRMRARLFMSITRLSSLWLSEPHRDLFSRVCFHRASDGEVLGFAALQRLQLCSQDKSQILAQLPEDHEVWGKQ